MKISKLSPRASWLYENFGKLGDYSMTCISGPWSCGKTFIGALSLGRHLSKLRDKHGITGLKIIIGGQTGVAIRRNIIHPLTQLFGNDFEETKKKTPDNAKQDAILFGHYVYFIGLNETGAEQRIRGISDVYCAFIDEATLCNANNIGLITGRFRGTMTIAKLRKAPWASKYFMVMFTNPSSPEHLLYKQYQAGTLNMVFWDSSDANYPGAKEFFEGQRRLHANNKTAIERYLEGKWTSAEGQVFSCFLPEHIVDGDLYPEEFDEVIVGIDYGTVHPTAVVFIGKSDDKWVAFKELKYQNMSTHDIAIKVIIELNKLRANKVRLTHKFYDHSAAGLKIDFDKLHEYLAPANKDVAAGIDFVNSLFSQNRLYIHSSCVNLINNLYMFIYKEDTEKVVKLNDDFTDALRYALFTYNKIVG